ncbi:MAG TPA: hypothetical protein VNM39_11640, partial [Verrucomicrobiae bacterium]|nr:hypothetical protein [Verrucomicrobiae bacterium]
MRPPNAVVNDEATNTINTGAPMANEYQTKPTSVSELSPEEQAATAKAYGTAPDAKTGLIPETAAQFEHLTKPVEQGGMGVKVDYVDRADNPYAQADGSTNYDAMRKDIVENKHIYVDKTSPDEANPILTPEQNNQFRAVHDVFGHSVAGNRFDANGEEVAYQHHAQMYSPDAQRALAMETRGQNSELNYSPENLARAAEGESKQFGPQRAGVMSKESSAPGYTHEPTEAELRSPTAAKETARTLKGPAPWAERAVSHLKPQGAANRVLASVESLHQGHALSVIDREQARYTEAQMNIADKKEPFIKAMGRAVEALRKEHPELKPHQASAMLGDELRSRITGATAPDLAKRAKEGGAPAHVVERLQRVGHQKGSMMPREFLTPAVEKSLRDLQDSYAGFQAKVHEGFAASETLADRGLSDMGPKDEQGQPRWTKQQRVLQQRIDKLESIAAKARTAKQEREIRRLTKERDALTTQKGRADEKVAQAQAERERAAEGVEAQRTHVPEPEAKPGKPLTKAVDENGEPRKVFHGTAHEFEKFDMGKKNYPGEGRALYFSGNRDVAATYGGEGSHVREQYLDLQNPAHEQFPRSGISPAEIADLKARGYDGIIMDDPARPGNKEYAVFDESQIHDTPDTLPREQVLPAPKTAKQMVRSTGPAPNEERQAAEAELRTNLAKIAGLPGKGQLRGAKSAEGDRMRVERQQLEQGIAANKDTIKNASKEEAPSSAYSRGVNIAYSARDVVDATNKLYEAQKVSDALQREIDKRTAKIEGTDLTDAEKEAQRADLLRVKTQMRLTKSLEDAPPAQWPREYRPAGVELEKLQEEAKTDPELRQWIEGAEPTFRTMMTRLAAMGIDPQ